VLGTVKNAALVIFCVIFLGESVTGLQGTGYTVALLGFSWYQWIKTTGGKAGWMPIPQLAKQPSGAEGRNGAKT
jgi:hypothetical protein